MQYDSGFELIMIGDDVTASGPVRWVTVPSGGSVEVDYPIRMTSSGSVDVTIMTRSSEGEVSMDRNIYVDVSVCFILLIMFICFIILLIVLMVNNNKKTFFLNF